MKFNKAEIALLANQPSHKFDKEGVLFVREKQEGFFKKNEGKARIVHLLDNFLSCCLFFFIVVLCQFYLMLCFVF